MKKLFVILLMLVAMIASAQWYPQVSGTTQNLRDVEFLNKTTGWIVGDGGVILKTTNGGKNWVNIPNPAVGKPLFKISIVDSNTVYVAGWFETIIKTTNGGLNWFEILNGPWGGGNSYTSCFFLNPNYGFIVGQTQVVWKTIDGGLNLTGGYLSGSFFDVYFKDYNTGIVAGSVVDCYKTTNGGINWNLMSFPFGFIGSIFYKISILNNNCWFIGNNRRVFYSPNFGNTWDTISNIPYISPTGTIYCSSFPDSLVGWSAGEYNRLFKTTNGGYNWTQENTGAGTWFWRDIYSYNDSIVWGVGGGGRIMHTTNGGQQLISIQNISTETPTKYSLSQNYPNPFNPTTNIKFSIVNSGDVKLVVYDIQGREVQTLVNESLKPGTYEAAFDGSALNSGVYFYKLVTGNFTETKKMLLIK